MTNKKKEEKKDYRVLYDELEKEIVSLRRQIGGYITAASKQKKQISELKSLNEELNLKIRDWVAHTTEVESKDRDLANTIKQQKSAIEEEKRLNERLTMDLEFYKDKYERLIKLPWFRRIFVKG